MTEEFTFGGVTLDPKELKMKTEFNLSEKIFCPYEEENVTRVIDIEDVKEAVRLLKEKASSWQCSGRYCNAHCDAIDSIKEIFGDKLA